MDSLTQFALGAAIGEAVLGKKAHVRAPLIGGAVASLPDLDVLYPFASDVSSFTWHRGVTHSLIVLALVAPIVTWCLLRTSLARSGSVREWGLVVFLALLTHPLLDALTVYGTQLLWPIVTPPVTWATLFIIDPWVTLPLVLGVVARRLHHRCSLLRHGNWLGLALACAYITWSVAAKLHVDRAFADALEVRGIAIDRMISMPLLLSTLSWRMIAIHEGGYTQGVLRIGGEAHLQSFESHPELLQGLPASADIERLKWFTGGFYKVTEEDGKVVFSDLRMGHEPNYFFRFVVGPEMDTAKQLPSPIDFERFSKMRDAL